MAHEEIARYIGTSGFQSYDALNTLILDNIRGAGIRYTFINDDSDEQTGSIIDLTHEQWNGGSGKDIANFISINLR